MSFPNKNIRAPFGAPEVITLESAATLAVTAQNSTTIVKVDLESAATLNVTPDAQLPIGSRLTISASSDGTARDLTLGTGITGPVLEGVINKTLVAEFVFDGSAFLQAGASVQID